MIVTLTLNPALDLSTETDVLVAEKKMRCQAPTLEAGGGGINVSKGIRELGGESLAVFPSGGPSGKHVEGLLLQRGVPFQAVPASAETRQNLVVREHATGKEYRFVFPGSSLSESDLAALELAVQAALSKAIFLVVSGSLPPGLPVSFLVRLAAWTRERGIRYVVDTSGPALQAVFTEGAYLIKPNLSELCTLAGTAWLPVADVEGVARRLLSQSPTSHLVVSMGPSGALVVGREQSFRVRAPEIVAKSTVGAGDSLLAGMIWSLARGEDMPTALTWGVACGSAAILYSGTQLFQKQDAHRLFGLLRSHPAMP